MWPGPQAEQYQAQEGSSWRMWPGPTWGWANRAPEGYRGVRRVRGLLENRMVVPLLLVPLRATSGAEGRDNHCEGSFVSSLLGP